MEGGGPLGRYLWHVHVNGPGAALGGSLLEIFTSLRVGCYTPDTAASDSPRSLSALHRALMSLSPSAYRAWSLLLPLRRAPALPSCNSTLRLSNPLRVPASSSGSPCRHYSLLSQGGRAMDRHFSGSSSRDAGSSGCGGSGRKRRRSGVLAYIALGSNVGDRISMIEQACREMDARGIKVKRTSSLWETKPMYVLDQNSFVNGACEVETGLEPRELLDELQSIEKSMGRKKLVDKGPRNIDLDILLYGDLEIDDERLIIPHIGIPEREFVLRPLAELVPHKLLSWQKPGKLIQDYLNELPLTDEPLSTLTPISRSVGPLNGLKATRKTHVMAILNITPDSFSDGGIHTPDSLRDTIAAFIRGGATMLDIGGQSTAPGKIEITPEEEISRVLPVIETVRSIPEARHVAISIDTYRASVAEAAVRAGADMINDVSAGLMDPAMLPTMARLGKTVCLMHMRGTPGTMSRLNEYPDGLVPTIARELLARVAAAEAAGVRRWRIVLDPGLGFAKLGEQNLQVLRHFDELRAWPGLRGLPWLVGSSRKSFIGKVTGVPKPMDRVFGTAATVAAAVQGGADIVRVHDVVEMGQVVKMADAIWRY
ncbi:Dihydropteroate synthase [Durotheca rogersii]|uniref:Dihydropteroate synthase n=1 Tax=Durotheca rogersii TaxID=419775 RepID=UPI0022207CA8|nr:Dihydropteroate synthase [Durotheca rogersii]KAI5866794.1 Dihydropteroate synthase [Durotheca rogersii]